MKVAIRASRCGSPSVRASPSASWRCSPCAPTRRAGGARSGGRCGGRWPAPASPGSRGDGGRAASACSRWATPRGWRTAPWPRSPGLAEIGDRLLPQLAAQGVMGQPLDLLGEPVGREPLDRLDDAGVEGAPPVLEQAPVGHLVRQRVLERVLEVRKEPRLVEELGGLEVGEAAAERLLRHVGDGLEQRERHVLADDGGRPAAAACPRARAGRCGRPGSPGPSPGSAASAMPSPAGRRHARPPGPSVSTSVRTLSSRKKGLPSVRSISRRLSGSKPRVVPEQGVEQLFGALGRQGVDAELPVVGLAAPGVLVLRSVVHEEQQAGGRQALDQAVEQRLGLGVDPVQVLEDQQERLDLALPQSSRLMPSSVRWRRCGGSSRCHWGSSTGTSRSQSSAGREGSSARSSDRSLPVTFSRILRASSRVLDLEVGLEQVDERQKRRRLPVGDGAALDDEPAVECGASG